MISNFTTIFSRKLAKRKADQLQLAAFLANEAGIKELAVDLSNEISFLRAEVEKLRGQRAQLLRDIHAIMYRKSRLGDGYTNPRMQAPFSNVPPRTGVTPPDATGTRKTAWRRVDRKAQALHSSYSVSSRGQMDGDYDISKLP